MNKDPLTDLVILAGGQTSMNGSIVIATFDQIL
jgi:SOS-response transcriptional repressor LexA